MRTHFARRFIVLRSQILMLPAMLPLLIGLVVLEPALVAPVRAQAPTLAVPLFNKVVTEGSAHLFVVQLGEAPASSAPYFFRWAFNGQSISDQISSSLLLRSITSATAGRYSVTVSNASGIVGSSAELTVIPPLAGSFDPTFRAPNSINNFVRASAVLADGGILIAGGFDNIDNQPAGFISRLKKDGSVDPTFDPGPRANAAVLCLAVLGDGKILIGGFFGNYDGHLRNNLARLESDGSLDFSFDPGAGLGGAVWALAVDEAGNVVVGGDFPQGVARFSSTGVRDPDFPVHQVGVAGSVKALLLQGPEKILVGGEFSQVNGENRTRIVRLTSTGAIDPSFNSLLAPNNFVMALKLQADGRILMGGSFTSVAAGAPHNRIVRLEANGAVDPTFNAGSGPSEQVSAIAVQANGQILIGGGFSTVGNLARPGLARLEANGTVDPGFNSLPQWSGWVESIEIVPGGEEILVAGNTFYLPTSEALRVARLKTEDSAPFAPVIEVTPVEGTFGAGSEFTIPARAFGVPTPEVWWLRNGLILNSITNDTLVLRNLRVGEGGRFTLVASNSLGISTGLVANITVSPAPQNPGAPDLEFYFPTPPFDWVNHIEFQKDGRAVVSGFSGGQLRGRRFDPNGTIDQSFELGLSSGTVLLDMAIQEDGKILVAGFFPGLPSLARLDTNGRIDASFLAVPGNTVRSVFPLPEGKLLIGGDFAAFSNHVTAGVALLNTNGAPDTNFSSKLPPNSSITCVAMQPDGKAVVGGYVLNDQFSSGPALLRLERDGGIDPTFDAGSGPNAAITGFVLQEDGKLLIAGRFTRFNGHPCNRLARLNPNGSVDASFDFRVGANHNIDVIRLDDERRLLVGGQFTFIQGVARNRFARLNPDGTVDTTFDPLGGADERVLAIAVSSAGQILIGGTFTKVNQVPRPALARIYNSDPTPLGPLIVRNPADRDVVVGMDVTFAVLAAAFPFPEYQWRYNGATLSAEVGPSLTLRNVELQQAGGYGVKVSIPRGGSVDSSTANLTVRPAPVNPGAPDISFYPGLGPNDTVRALVVDAMGRIVVGGSFTEFDEVKHRRITRLQPDGSVDKSFNPTDPLNSTVLAAAVQADGRIVVAGTFTNAGRFDRKRLARLHPDGGIDASFDPGVGPNGPVGALALLPEGKLLVGGSFNTIAGVASPGLARLDGDGKLDRTFRAVLPVNGLIYDVVPQADGTILVGGSFADGSKANLTRLVSGGQSDPRFLLQPPPNGPVHSIAVRSDGKILVGGSFTSIGGADRAFLALLEKNGTVNPSFNTVVSNQVFSVVIQTDGKILIGGLFQGVNGVVRRGLARLLPTGAIDPEFDTGEGLTDGTQYLDEYANLTDLTSVQAIALQGDGQILVGGDFHRVNLIDRSGVVRINDRERPPYLQIDSLAEVGASAVSLRWVNGYLQTAEDLEGPWTDLTRTRSPHIVAPDEAQRYFRLRLQ